MAESRLTYNLGRQLVVGVQLRSLPQIELPWITTFNLRWWRQIRYGQYPAPSSPETRPALSRGVQRA